MENIIQHIILDVSTNKHVIVKVNQYDIKIRDIHAKIVDNGRPYIIESTIIPRIKCKKSDGTIIVNDCSLLDNGDVHIKVTDQMTACAGIHECKLLLLNSLNGHEQALHTMKFYINVDKDVFSDDEITSSNEFIALENALLKLDKLKRITDDEIDALFS